MKKIFQFGEKIKGFEVKVLNEREARAAAGILFLFAMISFFIAFLSGNFTPIKIFITIFMIDFSIRVLINPKYSPSMILGKIATINQKVEYTGAPQKRFAWAIGLLLAIFMFYWLVLTNHSGILNLLICLFCLTLLFFETAFGICIGCWMYNKFTKRQAKHCPGGVCEIKRKEKIQKISINQIIILMLLIILIWAINLII